ncbi:MAG TPA: hypothetical protein HA367_06105 [Candidatus Methanofastidiosum sp.]|nr:hypothetical protein [Methanofastidiosum sp.]
MKKLLCILLLVMPSLLYSQQCNFHNKKPILELGFGGSIFDINTYASSNIAIHGTVVLQQFYINIGSNLAATYGGEETDENRPAYDPHRIRLYSVNTGYLFKINESIQIGPAIGLTIGKEIYISERNTFDSKAYYFGNIQKYYNFGVIGIIPLCDWARFYLGLGTSERIKVGLAYSIISN